MVLSNFSETIIFVCADLIQGECRQDIADLLVRNFTSPSVPAERFGMNEYVQTSHRCGGLGSMESARAYPAHTWLATQDAADMHCPATRCPLPDTIGDLHITAFRSIDSEFVNRCSVPPAELPLSSRHIDLGPSSIRGKLLRERKQRSERPGRNIF